MSGLQQGYFSVSFVLLVALLNPSIINIYNLALSSGTVWCYPYCWQICLSLGLGSFSCLVSRILLIQAFHLSHYLPLSPRLSLSSVISFLCSVLIPLQGLFLLFLFVTVSISVTDVVVRTSPITGVTYAFGVRVCLICSSGSFSVRILVHFIVLIISFLLPMITMVYLFILANSEYCWVALSLRQAFSEGPDQWCNRSECNLWVFALNMCIQSESWTTVCAFDYMRIACSFTGVWFSLYALHIHFNIFCTMGNFFTV